MHLFCWSSMKSARKRKEKNKMLNECFLYVVACQYWTEMISIDAAFYLQIIVYDSAIKVSINWFMQCNNRRLSKTKREIQLNLQRRTRSNRIRSLFSTTIVCSSCFFFFGRPFKLLSFSLFTQFFAITRANIFLF